MAGRPVNQRRRDELLDAVVDYAIAHGLAEVTWRPVARGLGVSPTTLVHRFGSKEGMLQAVQERLRERVLSATVATGATDLATSVRAVWQRVSDPSREAEFRLFFAVYGGALQAPELFAGFLDHVVADWMTQLLDVQGPDAAPDTAVQTATLAIATVRGLLLDLLATGDRRRVQAAADVFLSAVAAGRTPG